MTLGRVLGGARRLGWGVLANLLLVFCLSVLTAPLFNHYSEPSFVFGYSKGYALFLAVFTVPLLALLVLTVVLTPEKNKVMSVVLFCTWGLMEITASFIDAGRSYQQSHFYRRPAPYVMFTGLPLARWTDRGIQTDSSQSGSVEFVLNHHGFRGDDPVMPKPEGEYRIFILGGSVVFNGFPLEESIAGHLQRTLHEKGLSSATVYNWGVVSYVSTQELALLVHRVVDLRPDLVIVLDGYTDLSQPYNFDPRPGYPLNFVTLEEGLDRIENKAPFYKLLASLLYKSKALRFVYSQSQRDILVPVGKARDDAHYKTAGWEHEIVRIYLNNLAKTASLPKAFNFKLAVFLQPALVLKDHLVGKEQRILSGGEFDQYMLRQYARVEAGIARLGENYASDPNVGFFNLNTVFKDSDEEIFSDAVHITNDANKLVADEVTERLLERRLVPRT